MKTNRPPEFSVTDWKNMTEQLMTGSISGCDLSRPVQAGEIIDYFISHSWHDDAKAKWTKLLETSVVFRKEQGFFE